MFFSYAARVVAIVILLLGVFDVVGGFTLASLTPETRVVLLDRYFPLHQTTGSVIDRGIYLVLFAIGLGAVSEISFNIRKRT